MVGLSDLAHDLSCTLIIVRNITISMDESLLARAREHARKQGTTFNQMVRDLVAKEVAPNRGERTKAMLELAAKLSLKSEDGPMSREEAHERG